MNKIAVIGAGKTGRGFIGRLLAEADREILFVDKNEKLVQLLNERKSFQVHFFGNCRPPQTVGNYTAVTWENADLSDVELILVSVGGSNLKNVGKELASRICDGKQRYIITAENATKPAEVLLEAIREAESEETALEPIMDGGLRQQICVAAAESTVFCTTIEAGELDISSENYPYLQYDEAALTKCSAEKEGKTLTGGAAAEKNLAGKCGQFPEIPGLRPVDNFGNFLTRKLFTYNAASCVIAYNGFLKGYTDYGEAANDPEILELLDRNYAATNEVLCREFGYEKADQEEFALLSKKKFCDRTIVDTIARNAREPQRKLKKGERVMGPLVLLDQYGADTSVLVQTAAAMLLYTDESEKEWSEITGTKTPAQILEEIGGLPMGSRLSEEILRKREECLCRKSGKHRRP